MQPQAPESGIKTWQWVVTVIVIIVLIVVGIMVFSGKSSAPAVETPATTDTTGTNNAPAMSSIVMSDQYPGNVVYLSSVQLAAPGWVVIHKDNAGQPGAIIGETYVGAGINPAKVTLTAPMIDGGTYYAMLHSDDGDKKFNATTDVPLTDAKGNIIMHVFHASASAGSSTKG